MIMSELITELSYRYFNNKMPADLEEYLYDQYGDSDLRGEIYYDSFPYSKILADIEKYNNGELTIKVKTEEEKLQDDLDELSDMYGETMDKIRYLENEQTIINDFLDYFNLNVLYDHFKKNAHEETDEVGLKYLTI